MVKRKATHLDTDFGPYLPSFISMNLTESQEQILADAFLKAITKMVPEISERQNQEMDQKEQENNLCIL